MYFTLTKIRVDLRVTESRFFQDGEKFTISNKGIRF